MNRLNIVRFNDDNHAERIWANGEYIGALNDIEKVFSNLLNIINTNNMNGKEYFTGIDSTSIWVCDDFEDIDEDIIDDLWDWFNTVEEMTAEQIKLVKEKQWEQLHEIT